MRLDPLAPDAPVPVIIVFDLNYAVSISVDDHRKGLVDGSGDDEGLGAQFAVQSASFVVTPSFTR
jgi:hypothetical protein